MTVLLPQSPDAERVEKYIYPEPNSGCWLWDGAKISRSGYGRVVFRGYGGPRVWYAHRVVWILSGRAIPKGLELDHLCRNRSCVNPDHLEPVTGQENQKRKPVYRKTTPCEQCGGTDFKLIHQKCRGTKYRACVTCYPKMKLAISRRGGERKKAERRTRGLKRAGKPRWTPEQVVSMRSMYASGVKQAEIASTFGTSQGAVSRIVNREIWKDIP